MTWHTNLGTRTLTGAEAAFYLQLLKEIVDESRDMAEMGYQPDIPHYISYFKQITSDETLVVW